MRVSKQFYFLNKKISLAQNAQKSTKSTKCKQGTFFLIDVFYAHKSIKTIKTKKSISTKHQTNDFLLLRCFYVHKNAVSFVLHTKKHKKHIKRINLQRSKEATFFPLDIF